MFEGFDPVLSHSVPSNHHGHPLAVGDVLDFCSHDVLGFLVDGLVVPMGVDVGKDIGDPVVFSHP